MIQITNKQDLSKYVQLWKKENKSIGFVPTMGALHQGHLSLISESVKNNDVCICSIYVNPTQFNNEDDLAKYPKTLEQDIQKLESANCFAVYVPKNEDIYPEGFTKKKYDFGGLDNVMEGKFREGHFDGVAEVVLRLFSQVQPNNAYFGEKDFQQLQIIKLITKQEKLDIQIHGMPILREKSGLAMSSRNQRLNENEKEEASKIYSILQQAKKWFLDYSISEVIQKVEKEFSKTSMKLEYFQICEEETLQEARENNPKKKYRMFVAVFMNNVRLIDTISL
ncbi:MAG: pantoate--beta-alanine ligase [Flavobacteriales bacterium]|nr:pantoate--beta-alanine ligase [Flavobacteriales bacterium]